MHRTTSRRSTCSAGSQTMPSPSSRRDYTWDAVRCAPHTRRWGRGQVGLRELSGASSLQQGVRATEAPHAERAACGWTSLAAPWVNLSTSHRRLVLSHGPAPIAGSETAASTRAPDSGHRARASVGQLALARASPPAPCSLCTGHRQQHNHAAASDACPGWYTREGSVVQCRA